MVAEWVKACSEKEAGRGSVISVDAGGKAVMVANIGGTIYASDRTCTHADADLSRGFATEEGVRCPLHLSVFCMADGKPLNAPATEALATYNVKIQGGQVYVEV